MIKKFNKMNLVFLPGMDGTGDLFAPLLNQLNEYLCQVIRLPQNGSQDYLTLTNYVKEQLPSGDFVLLAESFSGPIAAQLAQQNLNNLKGIIFVATFLSSPNKYLLRIAKRLPLKLLSKFPAAHYFSKNLFLGSQTDKALISQFLEVVNQVPTKVMKDRMQVMQTLEFKEFNCSIPSVYILPESDKLITANKVSEFKSCFTNLVIHKIAGPHFILQATPEKSANIIIDHIQTLTNS